MKRKKRNTTTTSDFGTSGRVGHDSSAYYARALQPQIGKPLPEQEESAREVPSETLDRVFCHSSEQMHELPDRSTHLMVTSPPYNVGKKYDEDLSLDEYRDLLRRVLGETWRVLQPGGRACVNIANLGRRPYIPLHAYVIEDAATVGFVMRGEIIWNKGAGAGISTAWGSWMSASNPTLRDVHEYILVFQKLPFKHANPHNRKSTISREEFMNLTKSVWTFAPESAKRLGHPAPFPVELPRRLIELYSFAGDVVIDPFIGTGTSAVAALRTGRHFVGYETSKEYCDISTARISSELAA